MEILKLLVTASIPVLKVLLITALGSYLALDRVNILGEDARKHLNSVVFYVLNPALVSSNLANTITYKSMAKLWFMPINILITFIIGSALGWILIQLTRPPQRLRGLVLGCSAAGNLGSLMLIVVPALCKERGSPFGDPDVCYTYGLAYASLSMAIGAIYLWSYVYNIVRISSEAVKNSLRPQVSFNEQLLFSTDHHTDSYALSEAIPGVKQKLEMLLRKLNLKALFAPSAVGAFVGFIIGLVPIIRNSLIGSDAPLRVIHDSATLLGDGAIPTLTLIIGGNLVKGLSGTGVPKSIILGIIVVRFVALPLIGTLVVKGAVHWGLVNSKDPLYQFVLLLQFSLPPAMNIGTITQMFGVGENECSVIMLWCYSLASVSLTIWSTFFMWLVTS